MESSNSTIFDLSFFSNKEFIKKEDSKEIFVSIILNMPFKDNLAKSFLKLSNLIICADGGANRLYDYDQYILPTIITGDFDSIRDEVKEFYKQKNVNLIHRKDTRITDFEKCLYILLEKISDIVEKNEYDYELNFNIAIFGASGGKMDHTFSNYYLLSKYAISIRELVKSKIFICGENSLSMILSDKEENHIKLADFTNNQNGFSVFPLFSTVNITITEKSKTKSLTDYAIDTFLERSELVDFNLYSK